MAEVVGVCDHPEENPQALMPIQSPCDKTMYGGNFPFPGNPPNLQDCYVTTLQSPNRWDHQLAFAHA